MDPERWRRIQEVFQTVLDMPPAERRAWLDTTAARDATLAADVEGLLAAHDHADSWLEEGALAVDPELAARLQTAPPGLRIGPYRVLSEIGRGGMGAVYLAARDDEAFTQKVALKLIKRGMDSEQIVRRFVHERQILAALSHPNIARLLDGGSTEDGRPYFVMEHIVGQPIDVFADENRLGIEARLRLFVKICAAVQVAHQNLIVHRDLKPANILVDAEGEPKLLDFGIAKLLEPEALGGLSAVTELYQRPMTPEYASPEQLAGRGVTTATDVYGLGVLLYELLVGASPHAIEGRLGAGWARRPASQALRAMDDATVRPRSWWRRLRGDLNTLLGKAMAEDPARRYATAAALAEDVERHLARQPVMARRPTLAYRLGRTVLRHKLASALMLSIAVLAGGATYQAFELDRQRDRVEKERHHAEALGVFLKDLFRFADPEQHRGASMTAREILDTGARRLLAEDDEQHEERHGLIGLGVEPTTRSALLAEVGEVYSSLGLFREAQELLEKARAARCQDGEDDLDCARTLTALGYAMLGQSDFAAAQEVFERSLAIKRRFSGPLTKTAVDDLRGLGSMALEQGQLERAAIYLQEAVAMSRQAAPADPERLAESLRGLANLAAEEGRLDEAMTHLQEAVGILASALSEDHPTTVRVRGDLAAAIYQQGDYERAEQLFRDSLASRQRVLGPDHVEITLAWNNLAVVQQARGRYDEAEVSLRAALMMRDRLGSPPDLTLAKTLSSLAIVLRRRGELAAAREVYQQALAVLQDLGVGDLPEVANVMNGLAQVERAQGQPERAEELARRSLAIYQRIYGPDHAEVASSWQLLASALREVGRADAAEEAYRQSLRIRRQAFQPGHPRLAPALVSLGSVLVEGGRTAEAEVLLSEGLAILRRDLPVGDRRIALTEGHLGACYALLGRVEEARPLLESSYRSLLASDGAEHAETRQAASRLRRLPPSARR